MGLWRTITGRSRTARPDLDALFGVPSAAITLESAAGFVPTGVGSVCFKSAPGAAYQQVQTEVLAVIRSDPDTAQVEVSADDFGFTWLTIHSDPSALGDLCTGLHAMSTMLGEQGFDGGLLCALVGFGDPAGRRFGLVYLYKQGTFYAFAPDGENRRDNLLEIQVRDLLSGDLPMEPQLNRWLAVWGAPGL